LSIGRLLRRLYLLYLSQPAAERVLLQAIRRKPVRSIVELGIGFGGRTQRLLEIASWHKESLPLRYTGIDLFEARPSGHGGPSLKQAYGQLRLSGVNMQLVPGEPSAALRRVANSLTGTDLLLIAANQDRESLDRAWTWMPRMLTPQSLIFLEEPAGNADQMCWRPMKLLEIQQLAAQTGKRLRRAA
jgi:hypothetical protein